MEHRGKVNQSFNPTIHANTTAAPSDLRPPTRISKHPYQHAFVRHTPEVLARIRTRGIPLAARHTIRPRRVHDLVPPSRITIPRRHKVIAPRHGLHIY